ncbi:MAG: hypothetical protein JXM68_10775 [Sedimentisphaerales bacterium]|nr:hypothetical protein [Sedimentisphaerales bacterium]
MVYIDGDNNLEPYALSDFLEMASIGSDMNVNIVVMLDRIAGYSSAYDNWTDARRGGIDFGDTPVSSWGTVLGEANMGDPAVLEDFVLWAHQSYPSDKTMLVLWNHGGGWSEYFASVAMAEAITRTGSLPTEKEPEIEKAICQDFTSSDELTLSELREVLDRLSVREGVDIDILGMDACLMAMVEVVGEIRNNASMFIGSEVKEPGDGWPYDLFINDLQYNPRMSLAELGHTVVQRYCNYFQSDVALSAIDLSKVETLLASVDALADSLMVDIDSDPENCLTAANSVRAGLSESIVSHAASSDLSGLGGVSINFPTTGAGSDYAGHSMAFVRETSWPAFLDAFVSFPYDSWLRQAHRESIQVESDYFYYDLQSIVAGITANCPVGLSVWPISGQVFYGSESEGFSPEAVLYRLSNRTDSPVSWSITEKPAWLTITPESGVLAGVSETDIQVEVNAQATLSLTNGVYRNDITIADNTYNKNYTLEMGLALGMNDCLTEQFTGYGSDIFDLSNKTLTFTPQVNGTYKAIVTRANVFEVDTAGAVELELGDDDSYGVTLPGNYLSLFGVAYSQVFIGSNGYLTYGLSDTKYEDTIDSHFLKPRVSALFDDLNPVRGNCSISYLITDSSLVVTYRDILQVDGSVSSSFQIQHFYNGIIRITWLQVGTNDLIVGLSGGSKPEPFVESDFSNYLSAKADTGIPIAIDSSITILQSMREEIYLPAYDDGVPSPLTYIIDTLPQRGSLYAGDILIEAVPYSLGNTGYIEYQASDSYVGGDIFQWHVSDGLDDSSQADYVLNIMPLANYFTERFLPGACDLSGVSISFVPDGSDNYYFACRSHIDTLPIDPQSGTAVFDLSQGSNDERMETVYLANGKSISLYGQLWSVLHICSNGYIAFDSTKINYNFDLYEHFSRPHISMYYSDLNPPLGDSVTWQQLEDQVVVTFAGVPEFGTSVLRTFQVQMFYDGMIVLSWLNVSGNSKDVGVGLSAGGGMPSMFVASDFTDMDFCTGVYPVAANASYELWSGQEQAIALSATNVSSYVIETLPASGELYDGALLIDAVPYNLDANNVVLYVSDRQATLPDVFTWYALNADNGQVLASDFARVDLYFNQCSFLSAPEPVMPVNMQICQPANMPLQWQIPESDNKSVKKYNTRSAEQIAEIQAKSLLTGQQPGEGTVRAIPLLEFIGGGQALVNILVFAGYSDNSSGGELENTLNAIADNFSDFSVTLTDSEDPVALTQMLADHQVFLVPEQELIASSHVDILAEVFATVLPGYVENGGVVVVCDYSWGADRLLNATGLLQVNAASVLADDAVLRVAEQSRLTRSLPETFPATYGTVSYSEHNGDVIVVCEGSPVAIAKSIGAGSVLLLGWDYYSYDNSKSLIIANAVRSALSLYFYDVYLDTVNPPQTLLVTGYEYPVYDPGVLGTGETYYWQVEASNRCGDVVRGPVWTFTTAASLADFDGNCRVDLLDLAVIAQYWLNDECQNSWFNCSGVDIDRNGQVDIIDLETLAGQWLN